jgi:hypothetical protein
MDAFAYDESQVAQHGKFARKSLPYLLYLISFTLSNEWEKVGGTHEIIFQRF